MRERLTIRPLSASIGVEVAGLDLRRERGPAVATMLASLLYEHAVVCLRQQPLSPVELSQLGESFGPLVHHNEENLRLDGLPGVMSLSNADDRDDRQLNGGAHWHTDLVHSEAPASFTLLHAVAVPGSGGGTRFADQVAAYRELPDELRSGVERIKVRHCYEGRTDGSMPIFEHPLVRRHPVTGREALYGAADTGIGIVGMEPRQARALLAEYGRHATRDRYVYRHQYRVDDIVIWDNAQLLHCAERLERATSPATVRTMHRVSVRAWPQGDTND